MLATDNVVSPSPDGSARPWSGIRTIGARIRLALEGQAGLLELPGNLENPPAICRRSSAIR